MDDMDIDTSPRESRSYNHHPSKGRGRSSKAAAGHSSPPRHPSSPRNYDYSDDGDESDDGRDERHGPDMDVDDEIDELLSEDDGADRRGAEDDRHERDEDEDDEDGGGDASKPDGQRECLWEDCNQILENQADLVKHVQDGTCAARSQRYRS